MKIIAQWIEKARLRGDAYTSLDAMKLFAIICMTADHVGNYFVQDQLWWRAVGRIEIPVWFFLAGYSKSRKIDRMLWIYGILLIVNHLFTGRYILPGNALISVIVCRAMLNVFEDRRWLPGALPFIVAGCMMLTPLTNPFFEYGSIAVMFAVFGRMIAKKEKKDFLLLAAASYTTFMYWQFVWFEFDRPQGIFIALGTLAVVYWLATFRNTVLWSNWHDSWFKSFITILSRNTMAYYFWHRFIMEVVAALTLGDGLHLIPVTL